jgi:heme/copper-type cytochrome/quinol oxidase subunit 2
MDKITEGVVTVFTAIIGVAILAILVSPKAQTSSVIQAVASGFGNSLGVAESPVTGNQYQINLSYPNSGMGGMGFGGSSMPSLTMNY